MAVVLVARWVAREGEEERVLALLEQLAPGVAGRAGLPALPAVPRPGRPAALPDLRDLRRRGRLPRARRVGALPAARARRGRAAARGTRPLLLRDGRLRQYARFVAALFLVSLALRPQIIATAPLIPSIQADLGISHAVAGLLGTIPGALHGRLRAGGRLRVGRRSAPAGRSPARVVLIAAGGLLRVAVPDTGVLIVFTFPVGVGIAVAGHADARDREGTARAPPRVRRPGSTRRASSSARPCRRRSPSRSPICTAAGASSLAVFSVAAAISGAAWLVLRGPREASPCPCPAAEAAAAEPDRMDRVARVRDDRRLLLRAFRLARRTPMSSTAGRRAAPAPCWRSCRR